MLDASAFSRALDHQASALAGISRVMEKAFDAFAPSGNSPINKLAETFSKGMTRFPGSTAPAKGSGSEGDGDFSGMAKAAALSASALLKVAGAAATAATAFTLAFKAPVLGDFAKLGLEAVMAPFKKLGAGISTLLAPISAITQRANFMTTALSEASRASFAWVNALSSSQKIVQDAAGDFMKSVGDAMANPLQALPALAEKIKPFVNAFNPFVVEQFDDAMRSVYAVIGEALVPVMKMAADTVRDFAGYLRPALAQLQPVFADMARFLGGYFREIMPAFAGLIKELVPIFQVWLNKMKDNLAAWPDLTRQMLAWKMGFGSVWGIITGALKDFLRKIPIVGRFIGDAEKGPMIKGGAQKENIFSFGAPTAPSYRASESLGRDTLQAAYAAMPGFQDKKDEKDLLAEIAANTKKTADEIAKNQPGVVHKVAEGIGSSVEWLNQKLGGGLQKAYEASQEAVYPVPVGGFGVGASMLKGMDLGIRI